MHRVVAVAVEVHFHKLPRDPSLEATVYRWVARLATMRIEIEHASVTITRSGRHGTTVALALVLPDGAAPAAAVSHDDPYFAISEAFRMARRAIGERPDPTPLARPLAYVDGRSVR